MYETIDKSLFESRFKDYGRVGPNKNFSYRGLDVLFEYLEDLEQDLGEQIELDVIALCCDYRELTLSELWSDYEHLLQDLSRDDYDSDDELNKAMLQELSDHTTVLVVNPDDSPEQSTYIVAVF